MESIKILKLTKWSQYIRNEKLKKEMNTFKRVELRKDIRDMIHNWKNLYIQRHQNENDKDKLSKLLREYFKKPRLNLCLMMPCSRAASTRYYNLKAWDMTMNSMLLPTFGYKHLFIT